MRSITFFPYLLVLSVISWASCADKGTRVETPTTDVQSSDTSSSSSAGFSAWTVGPHPESVTIHGARVYVSQFGDALEPMTQDGDGYIAVYDANGQLVDTLVTGLDAPKGGQVIGDIFYVVDIDTLFGFNTSSGAMTFARPLPGNPQFLNGLAAGPAGELYVSATDAGKIWRVEPATGKISNVADLPGVNGLTVDRNTGSLYAVVYPQTETHVPGAYRVDTKTKALTRIGTYGGILDGVAVVGNELVVTDWNGQGPGRVVGIDLSTGADRIIAEDASFTGPANFDVLGDGLALIPMLLENRVVALRLKP